MPFPIMEIKPLVAIYIYDKHGNIIFKLEEPKDNIEAESIFKYFSHPITLIDWIIKYREITIFRGHFRATFFTLKGIIILFVSRIRTSALEVRPLIEEYMKQLFTQIIAELNGKIKPEIISYLIQEPLEKELVLETIVGLAEYLNVAIPEKIEVTPKKTISEKKEKIQVSEAKAFEESRPFAEVPQIEVFNMTEKILKTALKKAVMSLLFSTVRVCKSPAAAAYMYPKEDGSIGQLYAGNLEERKIIYVLETLARFPRVISEMLRSTEEIKVLNAEVVQIIVEDCHYGRILIGMTTSPDDVMNLGFRLKIMRHVIYNIGF